MDRLSIIIEEIRYTGQSKKGTIWRDDKEVEWRAYNASGVIHIVIEDKEVKDEVYNT